jgi:hypothetical protein
MHPEGNTSVYVTPSSGAKSQLIVKVNLSSEIVGYPATLPQILPYYLSSLTTLLSKDDIGESNLIIVVFKLPVTLGTKYVAGSKVDVTE